MTDFKQNTKFERPAYLVKTKSLREILGDLRKAELWLMTAAFAAFLASAFFVVKYFVGGEMTPEHWTSEQWLNAFLGLGITAVITAAQAFLYSSGYKGHAALIATFVVVFFGMFSEISQSMEREDATVRSRSENSAVFQATLGSISTLSTAPVVSGAATSELARARQKAAEIQTRIDNKNSCNSCVPETFKYLRGLLAEAQGRVGAAQARADMEMKIASNANAAALHSAITTAKSLEYDEDKHYAMIRLLKQLFGVSGIWASFVFSIIIIGTFEYAFHFVGAYVADHKKALLLIGRDRHGRRLDNGNPIPEQAALQEGKGPIPQDHGNDLREEYLDWVSPDRENLRPELKITEQPLPANGSGGAPANTYDFTQKRFFKLIYTEVRNLILNGDIKPTVRPVTDAVTTIIRHKAHLLGIQPAMMGKPQRQQIAQSILENLEQETVVLKNTDGGVGKAKYVLAPKYEQALHMDKMATG